MRRCRIGRYSIRARHFTANSLTHKAAKVESENLKDHLRDLKAFIPKTGIEDGEKTATPEKSPARPQLPLSPLMNSNREVGWLVPRASSKTTTNPKKSSQRPYLPLSPLMDPVYIAAKEKPHLPKPRPLPLAERTPFQRQLECSPYAQALASQVRMCSLTEIHLPRFFLQDFELIAHPETNEPWMMPRSLSSSSPSSQARKLAEAVINGGEGSGDRVGPRSYALSRAVLLYSFDKPGTAYHKKQKGLINRRIHRYSRYLSIDKIKFRSNLGGFVLELMRRRVVQGLAAVSDCITRGEIHDVKHLQDVGAVLWLRNPEETLHVETGEVATQEASRECESSEREDIVMEVSTGTLEPRDFATLDTDHDYVKKIPVHNFHRMLGRKHINDMMEHCPKLAGADILVLKNNENTRDVQMKLWKLHCYIFGIAVEDLETT